MKKALIFMIVALAFATGCNRNKNAVYIYNWTEYMPREVITMFEEETGIKVYYSTYDSNELMYSKLKLQDGKGYDIIVPSSYYVSKMAKEGLLAELDHSRLTNMQNLSAPLMNPVYDRGNKYSLPYMWGSSLLVYNDKYVSEATSWEDLWNPEYSGYVLLNNDVREVFQMALSMLGYNGNSVDEAEIAAAYEKLVPLMPAVRVFNSDSPKQPVIEEEVRIGLMWSGEIFRAQLVNEHIKYVVPEEGPIIWMDCVSIPVGAANVDNAYKFLDFIMRPDIAMMITEDVGYSTPNQTAIDTLMPEELKNNQLINPSAESLKNAQFQDDIGDAINIYDKYWEKLRAE
jgi:spermidine/putrescine transport system substrate-binding protein